MKKLLVAIVCLLLCVSLFAACNTIPTVKTLEFHSNRVESFTFDVRKITDKVALTYSEENLGSMTMTTTIYNAADITIGDILLENATGALTETTLSMLNGDSVVKKAFYTTKFNTRYSYDERTVNGKYTKTCYDYRDGAKITVFEKDETGTIVQTANFSASIPDLFADDAMLYAMIGCSKVTADKDYLSAFNLSYQSFQIDVGSFVNMTAAVGGSFSATVPYSKADAIETYGINIVKNNSNNLNGIPLVAFYGKKSITLGEESNAVEVEHPLIRINEGELTYVLTGLSATK